MLLEDAIKLYQKSLLITDHSPATIRGYRIELTGLSKYLQTKYNGLVYLDDINCQDIEDYLHYLKVKGLAPSSRGRALYIIRSFYKFAYNKELVAKNIALRLEPVKVPQKERIYLTDEEVKVLVNAISHKLVRIAVITLYNTGLRISEAMNLTLDDVDMQQKLIWVKGGKGGKDRVVPINAKLYAILNDYLANIRPKVNSNNFFATSKTGKLSPQTVNRQLRETVRKLGWNKWVSAHILRHSFASQLVKKNVNLVQIQRLLGHSSLRATSIYTHTNLEKLTEAVNEVNNISPPNKNTSLPERYLPLFELLELLEKNKSQLLGILTPDYCLEQLPRCTIPETDRPKCVYISDDLSKLVVEFSKSKHVSQRQIVESALVEYLKCYGFKAQIEALLGQL